MDAISLFQLSKYLCQGEGLASLMRLDSLEADSPAGSLNVRGSSEILGCSVGEHKSLLKRFKKSYQPQGFERWCTFQVWT